MRNLLLGMTLIMVLPVSAHGEPSVLWFNKWVRPSQCQRQLKTDPPWR